MYTHTHTHTHARTHARTHTHTALKFEQIYLFRNAIDCRKLCFVLTVFEQFLQVMLNVLGCRLTY